MQVPKAQAAVAARPLRQLIQAPSRRPLLPLLLLLLLLLPRVRHCATAPQRNVFGIGTYFPPGAEQIPVARELVGAGGWVLIFIPCGNVTNATALPPASEPFFDAAEQMREAWQLGMNVVASRQPRTSRTVCGLRAQRDTRQGALSRAKVPALPSWCRRSTLR